MNVMLKVSSFVIIINKYGPNDKFGMAVATKRSLCCASSTIICPIISYCINNKFEK